MVPPKVSHYRIFNKLYYVALKLPIRLDFFFVYLKYETSTIILSIQIKYSMCDLIYDISIFA